MPACCQICTDQILQVRLPVVQSVLTKACRYAYLLSDSTEMSDVMTSAIARFCYLSIKVSKLSKSARFFVSSARALVLDQVNLTPSFESSYSFGP